MQIATVKNMNRPGLYPIFFVVLLLIAIGSIAAGLEGSRPVPAPFVKISQDELEEKYGLRMDLVAVTAAGGFVDVRIRMVDAEKAKALLSEKNNFPALSVGRKTLLQAPGEIKSQEIRYENSGTLFIMYANSGGAVRPGTPVTVRFGDIAVDPVDAK